MTTTERQPLDHVVRLDLQRSVPFTVTRALGDSQPGDGLTFEGYAAVFGEETLIDSWEGTFYESIQKGAFKKSLRESSPRIQFDHGTHPLIGSIPIGVPTDLHEDDQGLFVGARLTDNWLIEPVRDAIRDGAINGMSFRFAVMVDEWRDSDGKLVKDDNLLELLWRPDDRGPLHRLLKEVKVPELGPVVFPAYAGTSASVRSVTIDLGRLDEREQRSQLARAVFMADVAERPPTDSAPQATDTKSAGEHAGSTTDPPPPTDAQSSAGKHESAPPSTDARALLREQIQRARAGMPKKGDS